MTRKKDRKEIIPKLIGADVEYGNFVSGHNHAGRSGMTASRLLLNEISGVPADSDSYFHLTNCQDISSAHSGSFTRGYENPGYHYYGTGQAYSVNPQDRGRKFLPFTGGSAYIDLDHLELCLPEVLSARDYVKYNRVLHELAAWAHKTVNAGLENGRRLHVHANNSDGENSWGSHLNFLISRKCFDDIFNRRLQNLLFLASYQASSIVFTGQGKVGSANGHAWADYQISQRADFFETMVGSQTTYNRPVVNARDESHSEDSMARLHCIFYDAVLCDLQNLLKTGVMQIILSMLEAGVINNQLILDDTLHALSVWSHDPSLSSKARTINGKHYTAVEHQLVFLEEAKKFIAGGILDDRIIPGVGEIMDIWEETLLMLKVRDFEKLVSRLDWVLKKQLLERAREKHSLEWESPQMRHLDLLYSSIDRTEGLYWLCERSGAVERIVSDEEIAKSMESAPHDTRAWLRSYLLRNAVNGEIEIEKINWDFIEFSLNEINQKGRLLTQRVRVDMNNPLGFTKKRCSALISGTESLRELILTIGEKINAYNSFPLWENLN